MKKTILITGSHRSGTTWVGNILTAASKTANIHEPFNINPMLFNPCSFEHWFQYIDESNEDTYYEKVRDVITYQYLLASALTKVGSARDVL